MATATQNILTAAAASHRAWMTAAVDGICARDRCTREALADALGVSRVALWQWCEGVSLPRLTTFLKLRALIDAAAVVKGGRLAQARPTDKP
jgi:transcriptional regulator with XRE-family HTH domain